MVFCLSFFLIVENGFYLCFNYLTWVYTMVIQEPLDPLFVLPDEALLEAML